MSSSPTLREEARCRETTPTGWLQRNLTWQEKASAHYSNCIGYSLVYKSRKQAVSYITDGYSGGISNDSALHRDVLMEWLVRLR